MTKKLVKYSLLYGFSAIVLRLAGFLVSMSLARELTTQAYGAWGVLYACQTGVTTFGIVGIQESVVGLLKSQTSAQKRSHLYRAANLASYQTLGLTCLISIVIFSTLVMPKYTNVIGMLSVLVSGAVLAYSALQSQIIRLEELHVRSLKFSFMLPLVGLVASFFAFITYRTIESFFLGYAISVILVLVLLKSQIMGASDESDNTELRKQVLKRVSPFVGVAFFGWLSGYGNNLVVDQLFDTSEVARITFALTIGSLAQITATALNQVWAPHFYNLVGQQRSTEYIESRNKLYFNAQAVVLGVMAALCVAVVPPLLMFLGGNLELYASMHFEMLFIFAGYIVLSPWTHCQNYFLAYDKGSAMLRVVLYTSILGLSVWVFAVWLLGSFGIYVGFFLQMLFRSIGIVLFSRKYWTLQIGWAGVLVGLAIAGISAAYVSNV